MAQPIEWDGGGFAQAVEECSGTPVRACFQCHKCSTGCPGGAEMDLLPSQVVRLVQLGTAQEVLSCAAIWVCASCQACTTRCPMGVDVAGVMDALRVMAVEHRVALGDPRPPAFHRSFLASVRRHGRVWEVGMTAAYKLRSGDLLADVDKVPELLAHGRLPLLPARTEGAAQVRRVFRRAAAQEEER
ncbi:MAG: 4Fe-4S dicluster domain-containing protein [Candidatus Latescibacterota bacterium]